MRHIAWLLMIADVLKANCFLLNQCAQIQVQRSDVLKELVLGFFEGHEDSSFLVLDRAVDQKINSQKRLARARSTADQCDPASRQSALCNFIEPFDAGGAFLQSSVIGRGSFVLERFSHVSAFCELHHPPERVGKVQQAYRQVFSINVRASRSAVCSETHIAA